MGEAAAGDERIDGVTLADIRAAAARLAGQVLETPCLESRTLSEVVGAQVFLKFENLQFTASFKERGALNKLLALAGQGVRGVVAASSRRRQATMRRGLPAMRRGWGCAR